jgi:hypothetical protein
MYRRDDRANVLVNVWPSVQLPVSAADGEHTVAFEATGDRASSSKTAFGQR